MSTRDELETPSNEGPDAATAADHSHDPATEAETPPKRLDLAVEITDSGPCKKHLKVTIPVEDIKSQFGDSLKEMRKEAQVPGFRPGRAPVGLVQKRFKKEVAGQVKSNLVMTALDQIDKDYKLLPISRPDLDIEAIDLKDNEPLQFEMELEVQPDFALPDYKNLTIERPKKTITDPQVEAELENFLDRYAQEVPKLEGGAELGDQLTVSLHFEKDGVQLNSIPEIKLRLQPELQFRDGHVPDFEKALAGARPGDTREADALMGSSTPDAAIRNQTIRAVFHILDLKSYRLPELTQDFLQGLGFDNREDLIQAIREMLERRADYSQKQAVRKSVLDRLVNQTPFDLPPDLVKRQTQSTLRRLVFELRQGGMSDGSIRAREAELRANAAESTTRSLKEFFILARIAEAEDVKVEEEDVEAEILSIAERSDESPRRIRNRIEKEGLGESLATQLLEQKTLQKILSFAQIVDVAAAPEFERQAETLDRTAGPELIEDEDESSEIVEIPLTDDAPAAE